MELFGCFYCDTGSHEKNYCEGVASIVTACGHKTAEGLELNQY